jgi:ABC-type bacteriocin/lantibiotic exporter with double-glycine peptidase domain
MTDDQTLLTAIVGAATGIAGAIAGWAGKRRQYARDDRVDAAAERNAAVIERTELIRTITESLVEPLREEVRELREWKVEAERRIDALEDRNDRLVAFIYRLIGIIRGHGIDHEIAPADVPPGIHIT